MLVQNRNIDLKTKERLVAKGLKHITKPETKTPLPNLVCNSKRPETVKYWLTDNRFWHTSGRILYTGQTRAKPFPQRDFVSDFAHDKNPIIEDLNKKYIKPQG